MTDRSVRATNGAVRDAYIPKLHNTISAISTFDAPDGSDRFVVLREKEFRAMHHALELAEQLAEQRKARRASGGAPDGPQAIPTPRTDGSAVSAMREFRDMSLRELADRTGLDEFYVAGIEDGSRRPTLTAMCKIARVLNVTVDELISH